MSAWIPTCFGVHRLRASGATAAANAIVSDRLLGRPPPCEINSEICLLACLLVCLLA